jgi:hypothetical protein
MKAKSKMGILNFIHQNEYNFTLSNNWCVKFFLFLNNP